MPIYQPAVAACDQRPRVDALLTTLAAREPVAYDLGTPQLDTTAAEFHKLVALGPANVPLLLAAALTAPAREAVWAVLALAELASPEAITDLDRLRAQYRFRRGQTMWEFAVIAQVEQAIQRIRNRAAATSG
jgi:hypothetical protein